MKTFYLIALTLLITAITVPPSQAAPSENSAAPALVIFPDKSATLEDKARYDHAFTLLMAGDWAALQPIMETAYKTPPTPYTGRRALYNYAQSWLHMPDLNATTLVQQLNDWVATFPDSTLPWTVLGITHTTYAFNSLNRSLFASPSPETQNLQSIAQHYETAANALVKATQLDHDNLQAWVSLIELSALRPKQNPALIKMAFDRFPNNYWLHRAIMITRLTKYQGAYEQDAVNYAKKITKQSAANSPIAALVIEAHWQTAMWQEAQEKKKYANLPTAAIQRLNIMTIAQYLAQDWVWQDITTALEASLKANPYNVRILTLSAELADRANRTPLAERYYARAVNIDPFYKRFEEDKPYNILRLNDFAVSRKAYDQSIVYLKKYLQAYPNDSTAQSLLEESYEQLKSTLQ